MKVLIVSTTERVGGGAIAAKRLLTALLAAGVSARMLVRDKQTDDVNVATCGGLLPKIMERLRLMFVLRKPMAKTWNYDLAQDGVDIISTPEYQEADIIHLHWVCQGMLSLKQLQQMVLSGKRIVWTMHDEWPFRGIAHYTDPSSPTGHAAEQMLEEKTRQRKFDIYRQGKIHFVGCSRWITDLARTAMPWAEVSHICNCIPQGIFRPQERQEAREYFSLPRMSPLILFSCQKVTDPRKGMDYLLQAIRLLPSPKPHLVVVGAGTSELFSAMQDLPQDNIHLIPYVEGERDMARLYSAVDCFVTPSLQDNLPNTIAEAMSCGTPCVGFFSGGIPEMISHGMNGYVAERGNSQDLAQGITAVLQHPEWRKQALHCARLTYSESHIAREYCKIYGIY